MDVTISSIGDADSLSGGTLLQTPLLGADDSVYAVTQGAILLGGFFEGGGDATLQKNHPTVGTIPDGAIVEAEIPTTVIEDGALTYLLKNPDYASAVKLAERVNDFFQMLLKPTHLKVFGFEFQRPMVKIPCLSLHR